MAKLLKTCPVCAAELAVVRLECESCGTGIDGRFTAGGLAGLTGERLEFVEVFVRNRGIIRDVEAELGLSYPTVRGMLDGVVDAMERANSLRTSAGDEARNVLAGLEAGEFDVDEALRRLGGRQGGRPDAEEIV